MVSLETEISGAIMLIDLSKVLSEKDRIIEVRTDIEMDYFLSKLGKYPFVNDKKVDLDITNVGKRSILIEGVISCSLKIPCDRCLEDVTNDFKIKVFKELDLTKRDENSEESSYIVDNALDVDQFVYNEILINLPMKVLCSTDCKGICNRCGANQSKGSCDCDTKELDPRMAKVLDIFNQFKEV